MDEPSIIGYAFQQRFIELAQKCLIGSTPLRVTFGNTGEGWVISKVITQDAFLKLQSPVDVVDGVFFWCVGNTALLCSPECLAMHSFNISWLCSCILPFPDFATEEAFVDAF